jgi:hypothetical protein
MKGISDTTLSQAVVTAPAASVRGHDTATGVTKGRCVTKGSNLVHWQAANHR